MDKIIIGSDHGGFKLKEKIKKYLEELGYEYDDFGTHSEESCDYPLIAKEVAEKVAKSNGRGILICGTGIGMCMTANKVKGIRAALVYDEFTTKLSREHNNSNILCLGERTSNSENFKDLVKMWLETEFSPEERHHRRVKEMDDL